MLSLRPPSHVWVVPLAVPRIPSRGCLRREADRFPREENRGPGTMKASERASKEPWACADGEVEAAVLTSKVKYESQEEGPGPAPQLLVEVSGQMKWTVVDEDV